TAKELLELPDIGKSMAGHISACAGSGCFPELEGLRRRFPAGLREMMSIQGLGPKRARYLFENAGIASLDQLAKAIEAEKLQGLPGFGAKLVENLRNGLAAAGGAARVPFPLARRQVEPIAALVRSWPGVSQVRIAGSLRRGRETVGDVDLLAEAEDGTAVTGRFAALGTVERVLASGPTKASVRLVGGLQIDLRVVPAASFGAALQYFTGSKEHNVALRQLALKKGLTLNEYGVFRLSDKKQKKPLAGRTEEEVYAALGLPYIEPELRENRGELEAARRGTLPRLVTLADVKGDVHNHSTHTDGHQSLEEMARGALARGWEWAALGDHSRSLHITNGMSVARLRASFKELDRIRKKVPGIRLMRSMEVDVLEDGRMDYPDGVLDEIDVVVGSVHSRFKQPGPEMTARIVRAAANPRVDVLGHLSGRLLNRRPGYAFDADAVLAAAGKAGTAVEINGQPDRQDVDDARARRAKELGSPLVLSTDAHSTAEFSHMETAVTIARRAWLEPKDCLNCLSYGDLRRWLDERRRRPKGAR
ncbi:MAG TPA: helix-hairpin-helix domain-containing protein, partial [Elusimicrobiota bacterium]|nr:helix-hairpin-helix domain-containing protein [Elusimicrobiota bacterium]